MGLHSKKRPHDLVFSRMFSGRILDMMEVGIEDIKEMSQFGVSLECHPGTPVSTLEIRRTARPVVSTERHKC